MLLSALTRADLSYPEPRSSAEPRAKPAGARVGVLIVEDDRVSRRVLAQLLAASGYAPEAAASGEEGLGLLRTGRRPKIALVDLDLPGINGLEFIRRMSEFDDHVTPVVVTAGGDDKLQAAIEARGIAFVRKPVDFEQLLTLLGELDERHDAGTGPGRRKGYPA